MKTAPHEYPAEGRRATVAALFLMSAVVAITGQQQQMAQRLTIFISDLLQLLPFIRIIGPVALWCVVSRNERQTI